MLILNLKTYKESNSNNLITLLNAIDEYSQENPSVANIIYVAPSVIHLAFVKNKYPNLNLISQHVDTKDAGSTTGFIPAENLIEEGVNYSILNHAEHRVWSQNIVSDVNSIHSKGLKLVIPCESLEEAKILIEANPYAIAFENKDLIGSGKSITTEMPDSVIEFINWGKGKTKLIIGAGVSSGDDVASGLAMGADGFILASAFVKATNPKEKLTELMNPFLNLK